MIEETPENLIRGWAKAYRDSPEHRFPSDPHAEFFPVDLEAAADEIVGLRLEHQHACQEIGVAVEERDFLRAALVAVAAARMPGEARRIALEALRVVVVKENMPPQKE